MANTVRLKRSAVQGKAPVVGDLSLGELAVNTYDGKLYTKKNDGSDAIVEIGGDPSQWTTSGSDIYYNTGNVATTGTSTAASFIPTSSTVPTNGIYLPSANNVALATNGTGRLFIDDTGSLTVTKSGFSGQIALFEGLNGKAEFKSTRSTGGSYSRISGTYAGNATDYWAIGSNGFTDGSFAIWAGAGSAERLRITSDGKLGVGTSSPGSKLDVTNGGLRLTDTSSSFSAQETISYFHDTNTQYAAIEFSPQNASQGYIYFKNRVGSGLTDVLTIQGSKVGIGTTTPGAALQIKKTSAGGDPTHLLLSNSSASAGTETSIYFAPNLVGATRAAKIAGLNEDGGNSTALTFSTNAEGNAPTEKARIDSSGRLLVGTSSGVFSNFFGLHVVYSSGACAFKETSGAAGNNLQVNWHTATSGDNRFLEFGTEGSYTIRGSITYNRGGGVTAYNTTSDYRAKTLLGSVENAGQTIDTLKVYRGVMNGATVERPMLVAHEAQEVAPYCVTGEKDAVDDDGNPIYQQMDHQVLVPLLIAEIQQLRARVAALEAQ